MDFPSCKPASPNPTTSKRTEFKDVNTSTEEELAMLVEEDRPVLGGGRGLLDTSDRLYLVEQTLLGQQAKNRELLERQAALQTFRSNALKVQAQKTSVPEIPIVKATNSLSNPQKKSAVVVKVKKRKSAMVEKETKTKKTKQVPSTGNCEIAKSDTCLAVENTVDCKHKNGAVCPSTKSPTTALLVEDYSSDEDEQ